MENKKAVPAVKVSGTRKVKENSKSQEKKNRELATQVKSPNVSSSKEAAVTDSQTKKGPQKRRQRRMTLTIKKVELPNGDREQSLRSPGNKDEGAISPKCTSSKKKKEGSNGVQFPIKSPLPKIQSEVARTDASSPQTSRAGDSLDPEMACEKEEGPRSPQSPGRKKGLVQEPIYLKNSLAPSSPTTGQRSLHLPTNEDNSSNKRLTKSVFSRRKAGFACDTKDDGQDSSERRREALCSTTDMFCTERRSVRIVRKKF